MVGRGVLRFKKGVCSKRVSGSVVLEASSSRARFICTTVVQIGVAGLLCLVYIVLVLVAVRFGLWTTMAELCFAVDDFIVLFSSNFSNSSSVIASYFVFF